MLLDEKQLKKLALDSFEAERTGNIELGLSLIHKEFTVTDLWIRGETLFPRLSGADVRELMKKAFPIEGRKFIFNLIVCDVEKQIVIVEFIESYPDPKTQKIYRTPQIAICQIKNGKIWRTRHYCDPAVTFNEVSSGSIEKALS